MLKSNPGNVCSMLSTIDQESACYADSLHNMLPSQDDGRSRRFNHSEIESMCQTRNQFGSIAIPIQQSLPDL
ncbi:hypothetical protein ACHAXS_004119 [Conticribra weissflogii]